MTAFRELFAAQDFTVRELPNEVVVVDDLPMRTWGSFDGPRALALAISIAATEVGADTVWVSDPVAREVGGRTQHYCYAVIGPRSDG